MAPRDTPATPVVAPEAPVARGARAQRSRRFAFTDFDLHDIAWYLQANPTYVIYGVETCPDTGRLHHQGYMELPQATTWSALQAKLPGVHLQEARRGQKANVTYCKKGGNFHEWGNPGHQGKRSDLEDLREIMDDASLPVKRRLAEVAKRNLTVFLMYRRGLEAYADIQRQPRNWITEVIYIWGETGLGKSRMAIEGGAIFITYHNGFVQGYDGDSPIVCFDDIGPNYFDRPFFLRATDRYPMKANIKGSEIEWAPRTIYLTSNFPPEVSLQNGEVDWSNSATARRLTRIVHLTEPWVPPPRPDEQDLRFLEVGSQDQPIDLDDGSDNGGEGRSGFGGVLRDDPFVCEEVLSDDE